MKNEIAGFSVIGELRWRAWDGVIADVWSVECGDGAGGHYVSEDPRLFVLLEKKGKGDITLFSGSVRASPAAATARPHRMDFVPAGMPLSSRVENLSFLRHLDLHIDANALRRRFSGDLDEGKLARPRLAFHDDRVAHLAGLIAEECLSDTPMHGLYGDGILAALFALLFDIRRGEERIRKKLSPHQLRRVQDHIEAHCMRAIRLHELADIAGLSESYFCHAFKATTGATPHQWQMQTRIRHAQSLMSQKRQSLTAIALSTGFSDQAHFTRVFKRYTGITPATWLREL
ncbi:MAG: AraC family transcriptional regulator [Shinella sp.]|nr:AraC family transcriptional regulator [Shinella sp.]